MVRHGAVGPGGHDAGEPRPLPLRLAEQPLQPARDLSLGASQRTLGEHLPQGRAGQRARVLQHGDLGVVLDGAQPRHQIRSQRQPPIRPAHRDPAGGRQVMALQQQPFAHGGLHRGVQRVAGLADLHPGRLIGCQEQVPRVGEQHSRFAVQQQRPRRAGEPAQVADVHRIAGDERRTVVPGGQQLPQPCAPTCRQLRRERIRQHHRRFPAIGRPAAAPAGRSRNRTRRSSRRPRPRRPSGAGTPPGPRGC